jgi:predicted O-methyltransferase YrrM
MDWRDIEGETPEPDCELLVGLVKTLPQDAIIVELGACRGRSGLAMAAACTHDQHVYMVDRFDIEKHCGQGGWVQPDRGVLDDNVALMGLEDRCTVIEGDTVEVGEAWDRGEIALLFVDASHAREGVKADLEAWLPHVRGCVCLHDYADYAEGVIEAAHEVFGRTPTKIHYLTGVYYHYA